MSPEDTYGSQSLLTVLEFLITLGITLLLAAYGKELNKWPDCEMANW